ncbi:hypothetical protein LMG28727_03489 [Paraburkholderia kirstenboschensis]|nr:hypothetical protein LMG28727_03489 [Paraburkholderia kirstenboschensis]
MASEPPPCRQAGGFAYTASEKSAAGNACMGSSLLACTGANPPLNRPVDVYSEIRRDDGHADGGPCDRRNFRRQPAKMQRLMELLDKR